jgi:predicted TIM-barrel fold metal-dependent hydrolase
MQKVFEEGKINLLGEVSNQYAGIAVDDPRMDAYYALAEQLDIPVGMHMGTGAPGSPYLFSPDYVAAFSNPLMLEPVLKKYPRLRLYIVHYGEPFIDEMITMMYHYPQLYVDLGGIQWCYPTEYFYEYHLKKLVYAGFGKRIMFGSDAFIWPELIGESIELINDADFLSPEQKADIFYNNAARFLRLEK